MSKDAPICLTRGACLLMPPGSAGGLHLLNRAPEGPTWQGVIWGLALISRDPHLTQGTTNWGPLTPGLDLPFLNLWTSISNSSGVYLDHAFFYRLPAFTINKSIIIIGGLLLSQNRWTCITSQLWSFIYSNPGHNFLKTCGLLFSTVAEFIWTMDFLLLTGGVF